nr:unnamed protein product [Digitaria exilis]
MQADGEVYKEHYVLVHGAGHGAWCWFKLASLLQASGHRVSCVDLAGAAGSLVDPNGVTSFDQYDAPLVDFMAALPDGGHKTLPPVNLGDRTGVPCGAAALPSLLHLQDPRSKLLSGSSIISHSQLASYEQIGASVPATTTTPAPAPTSALAAPLAGPHDHPSSAATPASATTPRLSPSAAPFLPSVGRGKAQRWADGSPASVASSSPGASSPPDSYRAALLRPSAPAPAPVRDPPPVPAPTPAPVRDPALPRPRPGLFVTYLEHESSPAAVSHDAAARPSSYMGFPFVGNRDGLDDGGGAPQTVVQPPLRRLSTGMALPSSWANALDADAVSVWLRVLGGSRRRRPAHGDFRSRKGDA